jgi:NADH oxidase (H2O2-forming)
LPNKIVVIGGGAAGMGAAGAAKQHDPQAEVTVLTGLPDAAYSPFGIPGFYRGEISGSGRLVRQAKDHYREQGLDIRYETHVESVDLAKGEVAVRGSGRLTFDRLVVATGSVCEAPDILGADLEGVYYMRDLRLAGAWDERLKSVKVAVVAGTRPAGVEIATALAGRGIETHLVDPHPWPMAEIADPDIMASVEESWRDLGVQLHADTAVEALSGAGKVQAVQTSRGELPAGLVVLATKKLPDTTLARQAGIKTGATGGVMVDARMVTSVPGVYSAGDCVELPEGFTRLPVQGWSGSHAHAQGKVAGANAAGDVGAYQPLYVPWSLEGENWAVGGVCFGETLAGTLDIPFVLGVAEGISRARYYPGFRKIRVKLLADPKTLQVIGAQLAGSEGIRERCDLLSLAARKAFTLDDLAWMENVYSPAMGALNEPIALAAQDGLRRASRS